MADAVHAADLILIGAIAAVALLGCLAAAAIALATYGLTRHLRGRHTHIPAAPDNQPGTDTDALWTCRRIAASDPDTRKEDGQ